MKRQHVNLTILPSILVAARRVAAKEGISLSEYTENALRRELGLPVTNREYEKISDQLESLREQIEKLKEKTRCLPPQGL